MRKFAMLAIAALLSISLVGCGDSDKQTSEKAGSGQGEITVSSKEDSGSAIANQTPSSSTVSGQSQTSAVSSTASQNMTDTQEVQNQLDELEKILDGLDDISEEDLVVPDP